MLKSLLELIEHYGWSDLNIVYIMSDFTEENINFWRSNPSFKPFLDQGLLDFARYDMEESGVIKLIEKDYTLSSNDFFNPLIVIGNYIFDTVTNDAFAVKEGELFEASISSSIDESYKNDLVPHLDKLETSFSLRPIQADNYYADSV